MEAGSQASPVGEVVRGRIERFRAELPEGCRGRVTMAVAVAQREDGTQAVLVSTSEPRGYLRPGVQLDPRDVLVSVHGHAERDAVEYCLRFSLKLLVIGATRPICQTCVELIRPTGAMIATPVNSAL